MKRILLIEDEASTRLLFKNRLEGFGYEVVMAATGAMGSVTVTGSSRPPAKAGAAAMLEASARPQRLRMFIICSVIQSPGGFLAGR